jgi:acyl carrier protein
MGLQLVELVMAVEEEFAFEISDADAEKTERVGDMHALILKTLRGRGESVDDAQVWKRLHKIVVEQLGVQPAEVTPSARFIEDLRAG